MHTQTLVLLALLHPEDPGTAEGYWVLGRPVPGWGHRG